MCAVLLASVSAIAACGGDDDAAPDASTDAVSTTSTLSGGTTDDGPDVTAADPADIPPATVAPDLPDDLVGQVGPVAVGGDALPPLAQVPDAEIPTAPAVGSVSPVLVGVIFDG
jgi:hypothetical protein